MAWLHATPEGAKKSRMTALKAMDENHSSLQMPDIESEHSAGYLVGLLQEAGLMSSTGMGPVPLSWHEIKCWMEVTGLQLNTWERLTVKALSDEYVSELVQATARDRPMPYSTIPVEEEIDRTAVANKISSILSKFIKGREPVEE